MMQTPYSPQSAVLQQAAMPQQAPPGYMPQMGGGVPGQQPMQNPGIPNPQAASVMPQVVQILGQVAQALSQAAQLLAQAQGPQSPVTQAIVKFAQMSMQLAQAIQSGGGAEPAAPGGQMQAGPPTGSSGHNAPRER